MATKPLTIDTNITTKPSDMQKWASSKLNGSATRKSKNNSEVNQEEDTTVVNRDLILAQDKRKPVTGTLVRKVVKHNIGKYDAEQVASLFNEACETMQDGLENFLQENLVGILDVMKDNRTNSLEDYIKASKFITYRQAGDSKTLAYTKTFPERVARMEAEGTCMSHLNSYATMYSKNKLVQKMQGMLMLPSHVLYQDVFHKAVMVQAELMTDVSVSPKVRSDAANSLMTHLKQPEVKQMELDVTIKESNILEQFKSTMADLAQAQRGKIIEGDYTVVDVAECKIYDKDKENPEFGEN